MDLAPVNIYQSTIQSESVVSSFISVVVKEHKNTFSVQLMILKLNALECIPLMMNYGSRTGEYYQSTIQSESVSLFIYHVTQPRVYENRLNWITEPAPPASRRVDEMTSPAPAPAVPPPPAEVHPRLPGRLRSRRQRRRKAAASANENSSHLASSPATRLR